MAKKREAIRTEYLEMFGMNFLLLKARSKESLKELWSSVLRDGEKGTYPLCDAILGDFDRSSATVSWYNHVENNKTINDIIFIANINRPQHNSTATIAHESYHVVNFIFQNIGHSHDPKNDELPAYLLGHIANIITDFLNDN